MTLYPLAPNFLGKCYQKCKKIYVFSKIGDNYDVKSSFLKHCYLGCLILTAFLVDFTIKWLFGENHGDSDKQELSLIINQLLMNAY